jgi:peptide/nickel transport system permease protein
MIIVQRLALASLTLLLVSIIVFSLTELLPGDVCTSFQRAETRLSEEWLENCREERGLNRPLGERYLEWGGNLLRLDFGNTLKGDDPINDLLGFRFRNTLLLGSIAALVGIPLAVASGVLSALHRDKPLDLVLSSTFIFTMTVPVFVIATLLILVFSVMLRWFPAVTIVRSNMTLTDLLPNIVLPTATLTLVMIAYIQRLVRTSLIDTLTSDFVQMAQLKGVPYRQIVLQHALPNALLPTINAIALTLAWLLGGTAIVEAVFNYPGLGTLLVQAIYDRDLPLVQAIALVGAAITVGFNLLADLAALALNPKLRTLRT